MNPFVTRFTRNEQWVVPITGMCLVLGFMIAVSWVKEENRQSRYSLLDPSQKGRVSQATIDIATFQEMSGVVDRLRMENTNLQNVLAKGTGNAQILNDSLQEVKVFAGLTKVEGPGVIVTLRDSAKGGVRVNDQTVYTPDTNVHDLDVLRIVNELFSAGAEAVAVNGHRIAGPTSIRCVGPTILINDVKVASPIVIKAIGDSATMIGGLNLNGGVLSEIRGSDPGMVSLEPIRKMELPAFAGRTNYRLARVPKDHK